MGQVVPSDIGEQFATMSDGLTQELFWGHAGSESRSMHCPTLTH